MKHGLDLLLINPGGSKKRIYQELSKDYSAIEPPFWAALTAGFLRNKNMNVRILDANAENLTFKETTEIIEDYNPKFVNIVVYGQQPAASTQLMSSVSNLCKELKDKNSSRNIILSGLHPSALPKRTLEEEKCDFVIQGEGFYTLLDLLNEKKLEEINGLWYWKNNEIKSNSPAKNIRNLTEELSDVAWDLLPMKKYKAHNWQCLGDLNSRPYYASLSTSLGCPFSCKFCAISATFGGERKIRTWDAEWVLKQAEELVDKYDVKNIKIIDEMFLFNKNHFQPIAKGLIERSYNLNIWAYARVDTTNEDSLEYLKEAGFNWLCFGFEAGNDSVRKETSKGNFAKEDILDVVKRTRSHDINILGNYIFGLPDDDLRTMNETFELSKEINSEFINFYCAIPYPGSQLYSECIQKKMPLPKSWEAYSQHSYEFIPLPTKYLSPKEVLKFRDNAFNEYFTNTKYLNMIEHKFGVSARKHIENMTHVNLRRKLLES